MKKEGSPVAVLFRLKKRKISEVLYGNSIS